MEIRPPHKPNYPAIADMLRAATGLPWSAERLVPMVMADAHYDPNLVLMAREKGEVMAFAVSVIVEETAWLKMLVVHPAGRRKGLARELLERLEERVFGEGARTFKAGFTPPPLFLPGAPEGEAAQFLQSMGYAPGPAGTLAVLDSNPGRDMGRPDTRAAHILMEAVAPGWWGEVEEQLTYDPPRVSMSADGKALCLADPGWSVGPLFEQGASPEALEEAVAGALHIAGSEAGELELRDFRPPQWWEGRLKLKSKSLCFEFSKDLTAEASR